MNRIVSRLSLPLAAICALFAPSCGDDPLGDVTDIAAAALCGELDLSCKGIAEAGGSITGVAELDSFFNASLNFKAQAGIIEADLQAAIGEMAGAFGLEATGELDADAKLVVDHIKADFGGKVDGAVQLEFVPPKCEVEAEVQVQAAARCDVDVKPGSVELECKGECVAEANVMVKCEGDAELKCRGTAPSFECEGSCSGTCELKAGGAECEGSCNGTCELDGTAACDGECMGTEEGGMCDGECKLNAGASCSGTCKGSCEITAPEAKCEGQCKGECVYTPPEGSCSASAQASCEAKGDASVKCQGECRGGFEPPKVKAECEASAKAEAEFSAECKPPKIGLSYKLDASLEGDVDARAEFEAQMVAFGKAYGKFTASLAKVDLVLKAGGGLASAGEGVVSGTIDAFASSDASFAAKFNVACAVGELPGALALIGDGVSTLEGSASAAGSVTGALGS